MHYKSFSPTAEISGAAILGALKSLADNSVNIDGILESHGLDKVEASKWYSFQVWLDVLSATSERYGPSTIFTLGKGIAMALNDIENFHDLIETLQSNSYRMSHLKGDTSTTELISFDEKSKSAISKVRSPYPAQYYRGVIIGTLRKFRPYAGAIPKVEIEETADPCLNIYHISW